LRKVPLKRVYPPEQASPIINFCRGELLESVRAAMKAPMNAPILEAASRRSMEIRKI
jgi:hypothetical protein